MTKKTQPIPAIVCFAPGTGWRWGYPGELGAILVRVSKTEITTATNYDTDDAERMGAVMGAADLIGWEDYTVARPPGKVVVKKVST